MEDFSERTRFDRMDLRNLMEEQMRESKEHQGPRPKLVVDKIIYRGEEFRIHRRRGCVERKSRNGNISYLPLARRGPPRARTHHVHDRTYISAARKEEIPKQGEQADDDVQVLGAEGGIEIDEEMKMELSAFKTPNEEEDWNKQLSRKEKKDAKKVKTPSVKEQELLQNESSVDNRKRKQDASISPKDKTTPTNTRGGEKKRQCRSVVNSQIQDS